MEIVSQEEYTLKLRLTQQRRNEDHWTPVWEGAGPRGVPSNTGRVTTDQGRAETRALGKCSDSVVVK